MKGQVCRIATHQCQTKISRFISISKFNKKVQKEMQHESKLGNCALSISPSALSSQFIVHFAPSIHAATIFQLHHVTEHRKDCPLQFFFETFETNMRLARSFGKRSRLRLCLCDRKASNVYVYKTLCMSSSCRDKDAWLLQTTQTNLTPCNPKKS